VKVKYNENDDELWCIMCKERIHIGEKYIVIQEKDFDDIIEKTYHPACVPEMEEE